MLAAGSVFGTLAVAEAAAAAGGAASAAWTFCLACCCFSHEAEGLREGDSSCCSDE